jgi:hypothetical protein
MVVYTTRDIFYIAIIMKSSIFRRTERINAWCGGRDKDHEKNITQAGKATERAVGGPKRIGQEFRRHDSQSSAINNRIPPTSL